MNKKFLIGAAIATSLLLSACVKKETPKEEEQEQTVENTQQTEPVQNLDPVEPAEPEIPTTVSIEHHETNNTSTTIRRESHEVTQQPVATQVANNAVHETAPAEAVKPKPETTVATPKSSSNAAQSEDDAVAAAIAAATPALN